jgi:hypothetical protein
MLGDRTPSAIARTIVNNDDLERLAAFFRGRHRPAKKFGQHLLFVQAGSDNGELGMAVGHEATSAGKIIGLQKGQWQLLAKSLLTNGTSQTALVS